jgi:hypothetical protein
MWYEILLNFGVISIYLFVLACFILANIVFGLYGNISKLKKKFSWKKFLDGLWKGGSVTGGILLLAAGLTAIPHLQTAPEVQTVLSTIGIVLLYGVLAYAIVKYAQSALYNLGNIFGVNKKDEKEQR